MPTSSTVDAHRDKRVARHESPKGVGCSLRIFVEAARTRGGNLLANHAHRKAFERATQPSISREVLFQFFQQLSCAGMECV